MITQSKTVQTVAPSAERRADTLTPRQGAVAIGIGVGLWFVAALTVQFGAPIGLFGPTASAIVFALTIPIGWVTVVATKKVAALNSRQILPAIAAGTVAAACCDGIALTWARGLYGTDPAQIVLGAAWILWGVGCILLFALVDTYRQ